VARNMKQVGLDVPLFQSHGFGNIKYVEKGDEAANGTIFPGGRLLVAYDLPDDHPQKNVLVKYKADYEAQFKEDASNFGGYAYDALLLLTEAIKKAGSTDSVKVRETLENLKGVAGTTGVFNFTPEDHNGLSPDAFQMLMVKNGKFVIYEPYQMIMDLPVGIEVTHSPNPVKAMHGGRSGYPYTWLYRTSVRSLTQTLTIEEFGSFHFVNGQWRFANYTGKPFAISDFAEWYSCTDGTLKPGVEFSDPNNWSGSQTLEAGRKLWYFVGVDASGKRWRGSAVVEELAAVEEPK
jgi:hypothetical protein